MCRRRPWGFFRRNGEHVRSGRAHCRRRSSRDEQGVSALVHQRDSCSHAQPARGASGHSNSCNAEWRYCRSARRRDRGSKACARGRAGVAGLVEMWNLAGSRVGLSQMIGVRHPHRSRAVQKGSPKDGFPKLLKTWRTTEPLCPNFSPKLSRQCGSACSASAAVSFLRRRRPLALLRSFLSFTVGPIDVCGVASSGVKQIPEEHHRGNLDRF